MNTYYPEQKPGLVTAIAVMTLASGIINLFWGFVASATALGTIVGVICLPITILPTILGIFEIIYAAKLLSAQPQPTQPSTSIAVLQILTFMLGNIFSMVVGILALIFYNDVTVKDYFTRLNGGVPAAPTPRTPIEPQPESTPVVVDEAAPEELEQPEKPKRARKTAEK
jgi:vacuolar-type H+-ATPase subunit I/STV1